jgi:hypothetical protein
MSSERAFAALTLLVAACEQAVVELEALERTPRPLVDHVIAVRDEAADAARSLGASPRVPILRVSAGP